MAEATFHIAMYPWFGIGHLTPFLHLSNKLAKIGHRISFLLPSNAQQKLEPFNLHSHLISFVPVSVPSVEGLPPGAETTSDIPFSLEPLLMTAMDRTEDEVEILLRILNVDVVFFDFTHWMPSLARRIGIKSVQYSIIPPVTIGYALSPERRNHEGSLTEAGLMNPPAGFPAAFIKLHPHEARDFAARTNMKFGGDVSFFDRLYSGLTESDALGYSTCMELEGPFCEYLENQYRKPILLAGPAIPAPPSSELENRWFSWLNRFRESSVLYCALGSECRLQKQQFQELLLGLELTGMPFLAALKAPSGSNTIEDALPNGFNERIQGRGVVYGGWIQQQLILQHPSVGCFVTHCGWASLSEALVNKCQLILLPQAGDQIIHARIMSGILKVGVEVEKGEDGLLTKNGIVEAVRTVMDAKSRVGVEVRAKRDQLREFLLNKDLQQSYINTFSQKLQKILG